MEHSPIPDRLRHAVDAYHLRRQHHPLWHRRQSPLPVSGSPNRGDLLVLSTDLHGGSRVLAVMARNHTTQLVVWLVHTSPELATEWDVVLEPGVAAPYPLVIQGDLAFTCMPERVTGRVGQVSLPVCRAVGDVDWSDGKSIRDLGQHHLPLSPFGCPRRSHKESELDRINPFQAEVLDRIVWPDE